MSMDLSDLADLPDCPCGHAAVCHRAQLTIVGRKFYVTANLCGECDCPGYRITVQNPRICYKLEGFKEV